MVKNYLLTILRQLRKNTLFSFINIFGLAIGIAICLVISKFVSFHRSFDNYHPMKDRVFRLERIVHKQDQFHENSAKSSAFLAENLLDQNPHIDGLARFYQMDYQNNSLIYSRDGQVISYDESKIYAVDADVFSIFDLKVLAGDVSVFDEPGKMVLTASTAKKYFKEPSASIGANVALGGNMGNFQYEVIAIIEDMPKNSHLDFNLLVSMASTENYRNSLKKWVSNSVYAYFLVKNEQSLESIGQQVKAMHDEHIATRMTELGFTVEYIFTKLEDIHIYSNVTTDFKRGIDYKMLYGLYLVALIILIIAWINYLNLSLVKTLERLKEIGIRKSMGSSTKQITQLFMAESLMINLIAFFVAITIAQISAIFTEDLAGITFSLQDYWPVTLQIFTIVLIGSVLIGFYPAFALKTMNTTDILLGNRKHQKVSSISLRSGLVSLQFVITFLLIAITLTVYQQITYMKEADLGIDIHDIMVIKAPPGAIHEDDRQDVVSYNAFKTELLKNPGVKKVTNAGEIPGEHISWGTSIKLRNQSNEEEIVTRLVSMDFDFLDFFDLQPVAGRALRKDDSPWTKGDVVINERMSELLGFEDPEDAIGAKLEGFYAPIEVRGVIENHHHTSLKNDFYPIIYILSSWTEYYFIRFDIQEGKDKKQQVAEYRQLVNQVKGSWDQFFPQNVIDYFFLDQFFNQQYHDDEQFGKIFGTFAGLAIFIACLGLFGLTSFSLQQKTKEIGIRKVLGAKMSDLLVLLSRNYLMLILLAYFIAMPIAWMLLNRWLESYHFKISLGAPLFVFPLVLVIAISLMTIVMRIINAVRVNPVDSLKYE